MPDRPLRVLHIDDEADLLSTVAAVLSGEAIVTGAGSLAEARALLRAGQFDLLLVDLNLPDSSGAHTVAALVGADLPIVVLTAATDPAVLVEAMEAGADDYIVKPVSAVTLASRLHFAYTRFCRARAREEAAQRGRPNRRRLEGERFEAIKPFISCAGLACH